MFTVIMPAPGEDNIAEVVLQPQRLIVFWQSCSF
jgi:hypothetical protein